MAATMSSLVPTGRAFTAMICADGKAHTRARCFSAARTPRENGSEERRAFLYCGAFLQSMERAQHLGANLYSLLRDGRRADRHLTDTKSEVIRAI